VMKSWSDSIGGAISAVRDNLLRDGYTIKQVKYAEENLKNFSILLCGSARVGKSSLINAMVGKDVAEVSDSLDSCTKTTKRYDLVIEKFESKIASLTFWDTPGIENWTEIDAKNYIYSLMDASNPICVIFCAKPGSLAKPNVVRWICEACAGSKIFIALVCTNKYAGGKSARDHTISELKQVLANVSGETPNENSNGVLKVTRIGLVASVNSTQYVDEDLNVDKNPEGIDELIFEIMRELDGDTLKAWSLAVLNNASFWTKVEFGVDRVFRLVFSIFGWN